MTPEDDNTHVDSEDEVDEYDDKGDTGEVEWDEKQS